MFLTWEPDDPTHFIREFKPAVDVVPSHELLAEALANYKGEYLMVDSLSPLTMNNRCMEASFPERDMSRPFSNQTDGIHPVRKIRQSGLYGTFGKKPGGLGAGYDGKLNWEPASWVSPGSIFPSDIPPFRLHPVTLLYRGLRHSRKRKYYRASNVGKSTTIDYAMHMFRGFEDELADNYKVDFSTVFIPPHILKGSTMGKSVHASFYDYIGMLGSPGYTPTPYQAEVIKMLGSFAINANLRKK
jgi:hypothetical protein